MKTQKIETFLPIINRFYNNLFKLDKKKKNIDYEKYRDDIAKKVCNIIQKKLSDYIVSIEYYKPIFVGCSNIFDNDLVYIIKPKQKEIKKFLYENLTEFNKYLKNTYKDTYNSEKEAFCFGYSYDFNNFKKDTKDCSTFDIDFRALGIALSFIAEQLEINELSLYKELEQ